MREHKSIHPEFVNFLLKEYEQSYSQMRHYDESLFAYLKFIITFYSGAAAAFIAVANNGQIIPDGAKGEVLILFFDIFLYFVNILFLVYIRQLRTYFVPVARQVNTLRNYFIKNYDSVFGGLNNLKFDNNEPTHNNRYSTYSFTIYFLLFVGLIISFMVFYNIYLLLYIVDWISGNAIIMLLICLLSIPFGYLPSYFISRSLKKVDMSNKQ